MKFDASMQYPFGEEIGEEFKQDLYEMYKQYEDVLPPQFFEAINNKTLFDNQALMAEFEQWCQQERDSLREASNKIYKQREGIVAKLHDSAHPFMMETFHDGQILKAEQQQNEFVLFMNMSGGFIAHAFVELRFQNARLEGDLEGYYLYDELIETDEGFALRILSSYGYPFTETTIYFRDLTARGVFRPAVYIEPQGVSSWEEFVNALNPHDKFYTIQHHTFVEVKLETLIENEKGIFAGDILLGKNYEKARGRIFCATYENPYAHLSEPIANDELFDAVFSDDQTLRVRAFNTIFARGEEVAPIVNEILTKAEVHTEQNMYYSAMAYHFNELNCLQEELWNKWK